jgi:hypothetical protein
MFVCDVIGGGKGSPGNVESVFEYLEFIIWR